MPPVLRLLHLEDEPLDTELVRSLLNEEGIAVELERVETLEQFSAALARGGYALILSDYTIPGVDPFETLRLAQKYCPDVPLIFVSGTIQEDTAIDALKMGASDYVFKQRMERLVPAVRRTLRESEEQAKRRRAEQELRKTKEQLAEANQGLERLVELRTQRLKEAVGELEHISYSLAHDMRSPLRAIQSFAGLLEEEEQARLSGEGREFLARIRKAADRMDHLIRDVLSYSKIVRSELPLGRVELTVLIRNIVDIYPEFQPPKADLAIQPDLPAVLANEAGLTQCFSNLLGNAIKFTKPGQMPKIKVYAGQTSSGWVRVIVEDNGIGMPQESQERIFGLFERLSGAYEGTGIGLAIVKKAAERMGGRVGVESELGKGSRFWVELRLAP